MREDVPAELIETRVTGPEAIAQAAAARRRPDGPLGPDGRVMSSAADHPARGRSARAAARTRWPTARGCSTGSSSRCRAPG
jgi:hypothetical protein